ncbi:MAG: hypothetical protein LBH98_08465 [Chitinispirillales bacterium]|nr:hypothetical protein [Chitinispirillales bacterium]
MTTVCKTSKTETILSLLFSTAQTVYAHITAKLNYAFDTVNSLLRFTPPPPPSNSAPILLQSGFADTNQHCFLTFLI